MTSTLRSTRLWAEACALPETLQQTIDAEEGFDELAALLGGDGTRRVVATGNGAAYYAGLALWLAALGSPVRSAPEVVAIPAGLLARGFEWREGDRLLAISSSGENRDVVEALAAGAPRPFGAVTSTPGSTVAVDAAAIARVRIESQDALTHTQAYGGNVLAALAVWAKATEDRGLTEATRSVPDAVASALVASAGWADAAADGVGQPPAAICFGSGPAWAAALEAALLMKEVARVPAEGLETREGATSGMYALDRGHLVVSLPTGPDAIVDEAEVVCRRTGATVLRAPGGDAADARLATLTTFPATLALAIGIGLRCGVDVDQPAWRDAYYATARSPDQSTTRSEKGDA